MRAGDHVIELQQRVIRHRRLHRPDVQPGAGDDAPGQGRRQCQLVVDAATGGGDEPGGGFHQRELAGADHAERFGGARAVDRDEIGAAQQVVEFDFFGAGGGDLFGGQIRVVSQHGHGEQAPAQFGQAGADIAQADDADGPAVDVVAGIGGAVDACLAAHVAVGLDDAFGQDDEHAEHVLGHRLAVAAGLVDREHAGGGAGLHVDGVVAGAAAGEHKQVGGAGKQGGGAVHVGGDIGAGGAYLVGVGLGQHDVGFGRRGVAEQLVQADVGTGGEQIGEHLVGEPVEIEHVLGVGGHRAGRTPGERGRSLAAGVAVGNRGMEGQLFTRRILFAPLPGKHYCCGNVPRWRRVSRRM